MILKVRQYGDPVLKQVAARVEEITEEVINLAKDMTETMYAHSNGVGLSANQVGSLLRVIVVDYTRLQPGKVGHARHPLVMINPEILESSVEDEAFGEGCLSIPEVRGIVHRPSKVKVRWLDQRGKTHEKWLIDVQARIVQHEVDHLDGVLFVDRMTVNQRSTIVGQLSRLRQEFNSANKVEETA